MESHRELVRLLASQFGHSILVLDTGGGEDWREIEGVSRVKARVHLRRHPALRVLTGWQSALKEFRPELLLYLDEPYCLQVFFFSSYARSRRIPFLFLSCQNIDRRLPFPFGQIERRALPRASGAWFLNHDAMSRARKRGFCGIGKVIPLGIDPAVLPGNGKISSLPTERSRDVFTVGFVGRLVPEKGVADLIEACACSGVHLVVAGDGPERDSLRLLAEERGVETDWLGEVPSTEVWDVYRRMDLLVLPSRTTARWKEQFGRVLVEAMACGVPVAGSNSGEIPNVLGDAGRTFPEGDIESLAEIIRTFRDDRELRIETARRGYDLVRERYTWPRIAQMVQDLIEEVMREKSHGGA
jgi:glycosyltransferase involved in cell wall biosynthesis